MVIPRLWKVFAVLCFVFLAWRMVDIQFDVPEDRLGKGNSLSADLFSSLQQAGFLKLHDDGSLLLPAEDQALADQKKNPDDAKKHRLHKKLLSDLYGTVQGKQVRKQVTLWNIGHNLAAVRDDRSQEGDRTHWLSEDAVTQLPLSGIALLPAEFVYVGGGTLRGGFHNWFTSHHKKNPVRFTSVIPASAADTKGGKLHIQIIGQLQEKKSLLASLKAYKPKLLPRHIDNPKECGTAPLIAHELVLSLPKEHLEIPLAITVGAVSTYAQQLEEVALCLLPPGVEPDPENACQPKKRKVQLAGVGMDGEGEKTEEEPECRLVRTQLSGYQLHWEQGQLSHTSAVRRDVASGD